jgi:hypothetical protein
MIELKGNFDQDSFNYAERFLTLQNQIQTHWTLFPSEVLVDYSGIAQAIRDFSEQDKQFKERYFPQHKPFLFFSLEKNPSLRKVYYFPFEIVTPINCSYIFNEIKITG